MSNSYFSRTLRRIGEYLTQGNQVLQSHIGYQTLQPKDHYGPSITDVSVARARNFQWKADRQTPIKRDWPKLTGSIDEHVEADTPVQEISRSTPLRLLTHDSLRKPEIMPEAYGSKTSTFTAYGA